MPVLKIKDGSTWKAIDDLTLNSIKIKNKVISDKNGSLAINNDKIITENMLSDTKIAGKTVNWGNRENSQTLCFDDDYFITKSMLDNQNHIITSSSNNINQEGEYSLTRTQGTTFTIGSVKAHCFVTNSSQNTITINFSSDNYLKFADAIKSFELKKNETLEFNVYPHNNYKYIVCRLWE